jgi:hypothetical protein
MTVGLDDIDRWQPGAVREASTALGKRGAISPKPALTTWRASTTEYKPPTGAARPI